MNRRSTRAHASAKEQIFDERRDHENDHDDPDKGASPMPHIIPLPIMSFIMASSFHSAASFRAAGSASMVTKGTFDRAGSRQPLTSP